MAVTGCTTTDSKAVGSRCTLVTALPHHIGFTVTLTSHFVTLPTEGALRVALTGKSAIVNNGRNTADKFGAHLCQSGHWCDHEGVHTHVANHLLPMLLGFWLRTLETRKLGVLGDQNQRVNKYEGSEVSV